MGTQSHNFAFGPRSIWHVSIKADDAQSLERIQASVARMILKADWRTPRSNLLRQLDRPARRWRREIANLVFILRNSPDLSTALVRTSLPVCISEDNPADAEALPAFARTSKFYQRSEVFFLLDAH